VNEGVRHPTSVLSISNSNSAGRKKEHPTQKPDVLNDWVIRTFTSEGEHVLDHCFGSGGSGAVAVRLGRSYTGVEQDPLFFAIGKSRIDAEVEALRRDHTHARSDVPGTNPGLTPGDEFGG
jgi:DNA modification methylase